MKEKVLRLLVIIGIAVGLLWVSPQVSYATSTQQVPQQTFFQTVLHDVTTFSQHVFDAVSHTISLFFSQKSQKKSSVVTSSPVTRKTVTYVTETNDTVDISGLTTRVENLTKRYNALTGLSSSSAVASVATNTSIGDGAIVASSSGDFYPAISNSNSLGLSTNPWTVLYLTNAAIDKNGNFVFNGGGEVKGSLTVDQGIALPGTSGLSVSGTATFSGGVAFSNQVNFLSTTSFSGSTTLNGLTYTWPTSGQTNGYVLTTNGSGGLTWAQAANPNLLSGDVTLGTDSSNTITPNGLFNASLLPASTAVNLGSSGFNYGTVYAQNLILSATSGQGGFLQLNSGVLSPATLANTVAVGTTTPVAHSGLDIEQNGLGNSVLVINQKGTGDIMTASVSGTEKFVITSSGYLGVGTSTPTRPLQLSLNAADISNGAILHINGSMISTSNSQYGLRAVPNVAPGSASVQAYVGASMSLSSSSTNLSGATMEGLEGAPFYSGTGTVGTMVGAVFKETLSTNNSAVGTTNLGIQVLGAVRSGCTTCTFTNNAGIDITDQTIGTNNTNLLIGTNTIPSGTFSIYNSSLATNYFGGSMGIGTTAIGNGEVAINQPNVSGDIFSASSSGTTRFTISQTGNIAVNGGSITTTQSTANIFNATPTTINLGGNATAISMGAGTGSTTINNNLVLNNSAATTTFGGIAYVWPTSGQSSGYVLSTDGAGALSWTAAGGLGTNFWTLNSGFLSPSNGGSAVAIGQTTGLANSGLDIEQNGLGNSVLVINQKGSGDILTASVSGSEKFVINTSGYIGLGTATPTRPLQIGLNAPDIGSGAIIHVNGSMTSTSNSQYGLRAVPNVAPGSASVQAYVGASMSLSSSSTNLSGATMEGLEGAPFYSGTGTVGTMVGAIFKETLSTNNSAVGTTNLGIQVLGAVRSACTTCTFTNNAGIDITDQTIGTNNTNLLIGTSTIPSGTFSIYNSSLATNYFGGSMGIGTTAIGNAEVAISQPHAAGDIFTASQGATPLFRIDNSGNTRITSSLCVKATMSTACAGSTAGTIYATNTTVQAADVAENYISSQLLEPGDVIMPAQDGNNQAIMRTTAPYQSQALGVISTNPGITLNSDATRDALHPNLYPVALQGRVPVKVSTENGAITAGDVLTTSTIPGVAMKATKQGQIIGKALESYTIADTTVVGRIMVFVNLSSIIPQIQIATNGNLMVDGQPVSSFTQTQTNTNNSQLQALSATVTTLRDAVASLSGQLTQVSDLSTQLASLQQTIHIATLSALLSGAMPSPTADSTVGGTFSVVGRTMLADVGITGKISNGLLTINGMDTSDGSPAASITTLAGALHLQSTALNPVDFEQGKVSIDTHGNVTSAGVVSAKKYAIDTSDDLSASLGKGILPKGETSISIKTSAVTPHSNIFITPRNALVTPLFVSGQQDKTSFTVETMQAPSQDVHFDWWIVN